MAGAELIEIEVAYARPDCQVIVPFRVPRGATVREAVTASGLLLRFPDIDLAVNAVGVFGKAAALDRPLQAGDRVEIYRPLQTDPREARRRRAGRMT